MKPIILVVDDDKLDVRAVTDAIVHEDIKATLLIANNGRDALDLIEDKIRMEPASKILVLLDINMPQMNGHEFMQALRSKSLWAHIFVFYLTTSDHERDLAKAYSYGIQGYMIKSADTQILRKQMRFIGEFLERVSIPLP